MFVEGGCSGGEIGPICCICCGENSRDFGLTGEEAIQTLSNELSLDPVELQMAERRKIQEMLQITIKVNYNIGITLVY